MGGKTSKSTQTVSIPPEVLARYNAVNARAEQAAGTPFQPYSYNPADFAAQLTPTQLAGIQNVNYAAGQAQPYYDEATGQLMGAQMAAVPYYGQAGMDIGAGQGYGMQGLQGAQYNLMGAQDIGAQLAQQAYLQQAQAGQAAQPLQQYAQGIYGQAFQAAQPYNVAALQQYYGGLGAAAPISQAALANLAAGQQAGQDITSMALRQLGAGQAQAMPVQQAALEAVGLAPFAAAPMTQAAAANLAAAQAGAQPYQQMATQFGLAAGRPVMPGALTGQEIGQYMSPYIQNVVAPTAALLQQQAEQAQAGQLGNAIRAGAFGGDRAAIAAANLQQQQQLAQSKALADIMQSGYGQALATAQQQQQLGLTAEQANRAAQQATAAQLLGIGQTGFGQGLGTAQQQAALAQQMYGQQLGAGQAQAALAQQMFGQGATAAQQQQAAAQALFGQSAQAAQQQAALAQQLFGQQAAAGQNIAGLGQQTFQQGLASGQAQAALAQQLFGQGMSQAQQQAALSQLLFGQGTGIAQQQAALGQQGFQQQLAAAEARRALGQGLYGMGAGTAQQLAALGTGAQGAALSGAQAQLAAGQAQQQTAQAGLQALYNQFLQQQAYPFQAAQFLANVAMGTGALSGSTQTAVVPGGLFSDVRMKENIRKVGETFDGQPVYSYNYKGDDKTQMGMLAQEVEKRHPEAVGLAGGMKTVDYEKATRDSRKPVTIDGEYTASEGGPVSMAHAGETYARGGYADGGSPGLASPGDMAAILSAQAQMFGPFSQAGMPMGGLPGGQGYIPQANLPVSELVTPGAMPAAPNAIEQMRAIADIGKTGSEIYEKYKQKQAEKSAAKPAPKADGGSASLPYSTDGAKALAIPTEKIETTKLPTPEMPKGRSALEDVKDIATIAATIASISDSRVKEDIKHIGHTYDGQKIYSYRYKGEPQTHIGLLAQEVEKKHPDAVGNIKGIKTVDYDMATEDAARKAVDLARGKADGGGVMPYNMVPTSLGIPMQGSSGAKLSVPEMPKGKSAMDDIKDIADIAKSISDINESRDKKASGGRAGYALDGSVQDPSFAERMIPGIQTQAGVEANRRDIMRFLQERIADNPAINPLAAMRRAEANAKLQQQQPGLAPPAATTTPPAASTSTTATTKPRTETRVRPDGRTGTEAPPPVDNRNVFGSSQFANLPQSPAEGLGAMVGAPAAVSGETAGLAAPSAPASLTGEQDLGLAPTFGGTVKPMTAPGTTPSTNEVVAKDRSAPTESRMDAFLKWVREPQNFIPLATGIAAATAAPTRNTFVALAQGLGAGAQAYLPIQQKQAELEQTKAETGVKRVEAAAGLANIPTNAIILDTQGRTLGIRVYINGQPEVIPPGEFFRRQNQGEKFQFAPDIPGVTGPQGTAPAGTTAPAVSGAPGAPSVAPTAPAAVSTQAATRPLYEEIPSGMSAGIIQRANDVQSTGIPALSQLKESNPFSGQAVAANAQRQNRQQRNILAKAFADLPPEQSGIFASEVANPVFNWVSSTLTSLGVSPEFIAENIRDPKDLANQQVVSKITTQLAQQMQTEGGGVALGKFMQLLEAIPRLANTKEGQAELVASMYTQAQRELDLDRFYNLYRDKLQKEGGLNAAQSAYGGRGLEAEFSKQQDPVYVTEKALISKMFMQPVRGPDGQPISLLSYLIKKGGSLSERELESFRQQFKEYGKDGYDVARVLRYFGGG